MFVKRTCCCAYFGSYGTVYACVVGKKPLRFHGVMTNSRGGTNGPDFDAPLFWHAGSSWSGWYGAFSLDGDARVLSAANATCAGVNGPGTYSLLWKIPCVYNPFSKYWQTNAFSLSVIYYLSTPKIVDPGAGVSFTAGGEPILNPAIDWTGAPAYCKPSVHEIVTSRFTFSSASCKPMVLEIDDSEPIALPTTTSGYGYLKGSFLE